MSKNLFLGSITAAALIVTPPISAEDLAQAVVLKREMID